MSNRNAPTPTFEPTLEEVDPFVQAVRASLMFSFPGPKLGIDPSDQPSTDVFKEVTRELKRSFFVGTPDRPPVLVPRNEIGMLTSLIKSGRGTLLVGERGTGKSTIIYAALESMGALGRTFLRETELRESDLSKPVDDSYLHIHFNANLETSGFRDAAHPGNVFLVFLYRVLSAQVQDVVSARLWDRWRVGDPDLNSPGSDAFVDFRTELTANEIDMKTWAGSEALTPALQSRWHACDAKWRDAPIRGRALELIGFLISALKRTPIICVDNVDHLPTQTQVALVRELMELRRSTRVPFACVVAARPETLESISVPMSGDAQFSALKAEKTLLGESDFRLISDVISRRLSRVVSGLQLAMKAEGAPNTAVDLSVKKAELELVLESTTAMIARYLVVDSDNEDVNYQNQRFIDYFVEWYNGSIRAVASSFTDFISDLLQDQNPLFEFRKWAKRTARYLEENGRKKPNERLYELVRTAIFYHLLDESVSVWAEKRHSAKSNVLVLLPGLNSASQKLPFHFLELRVLQLLKTKGRLTVREVSELFVTHFQVNPASVHRAICTLAVPRFSDDMGLVRLDQLANQDLGAYSLDELCGLVSPETRVEIMPAGSMLAGTFIYTCEFLFGTLIHGDHGGLIGFHRFQTASKRDFRNSHLRALGASRYLEKVLLPVFKKEHPYVRNPEFVVLESERQGRLTSYHQLFGFGPNRWMIQRALDGVRSHVGLAMKTDAYLDVRGSREPVEKFCEVLDEVAKRARIF